MSDAAGGGEVPSLVPAAVEGKCPPHHEESPRLTGEVPCLNLGRGSALPNQVQSCLTAMPEGRRDLRLLEESLQLTGEVPCQ